MQYFAVLGCLQTREVLQQVQSLVAVLQISTSQFADDEIMRDNVAMHEQALQLRNACSEHVDPNRTVRENHYPYHALATRRRGTGFKPGMVPAKEASRLALSRSINARRPACNRA